ncbi:METHIONINE AMINOPEPTIDASE 1C CHLOROPLASTIC/MITOCHONDRIAL [Salix viminalis]|uniref:METHIONINE AMINOPEPTIDASE 1C CHLOROPLASTIC/MITOCHONDRIAL n=1 Tax=Salix viminalis TaxID=40686 RepID=A0A9Q0U0B6_SALVM|nr:METHIONINE AMINOPEPTIDASE 1C CHLOROPLASTIC/MITOCHONDRIAL [Salix viminalis]
MVERESVFCCHSLPLLLCNSPPPPPPHHHHHGQIQLFFRETSLSFSPPAGKKGTNSYKTRRVLKESFTSRRGHVNREPPYLGSNELPEIASEHQIHESEGIVKMRAAYELGAHVLENAVSSNLQFDLLHCFSCTNQIWPFTSPTQSPCAEPRCVWNQYFTAGSTGGVTWPNNRTTLTADGSPAAQFGHTISIIRTGVGILTC